MRKDGRDRKMHEEKQKGQKMTKYSNGELGKEMNQMEILEGKNKKVKESRPVLTRHCTGAYCTALARIFRRARTH